mmetsp:Transcript_5880/g.9519  ORF Transcript_5880/g.9519 Transcript_5880/m.9519 type:complete len:115 (+) Transcript_5880:2468-2812(+)
MTMALERGLIGLSSLLNLQYKHMFGPVFNSPNSVPVPHPILANHNLIDFRYEEKQIANKSREQVMSLLCSTMTVPTRNFNRQLINDQLVLQTIGTLALLLTKCRNVSQSLLFHE